jgi:YD repeat-containing protein
MNKNLHLRLVFFIILTFFFSTLLCVAGAKYEYDSNSRLSSITYPDGSRIEYTYDANGNRRSQRIGGPVLVGNFEPTSKEVASGSGTYKIQLSANGPWELKVSEPWLNVSPLQGTRDAEIALSFPANPSYRPRAATVSVAGISHRLRQAAGLANPTALVSQPMDLLVAGEGRILGVSGLPQGMRYDAKSGTLIGSPTRGGNHTVRITADVPGTGRTVQEMALPVTALPAWAVGTFTALIPIPGHHPSGVRMLGGDLTLTTTASGSFTGRLRLGAAAHGFRGRIQSAPADLANGVLKSQVLIVPNPRNRSLDIALSLAIRDNSSTAQPGLTGQVTVDGSALPIGPGWRHVWNARTNPAFGGINHRMHAILASLWPTDDEDGSPGGHGFSVIQLLPTGRARFHTTLADGTRLLADSPVSPEGVCGAYHPFTRNTGCAQLILSASSTLLEGELRWLRFPNQSTVDYPAGFDLATQIIGRPYSAPPRGVYLFTETANHPGPILLVLQGHGLPAEPAFSDYASLDDVQIPLGLSALNKLAPPAGTPFRLSCNLTASAGIITGAFTLPRTWSNGKPGKVTAPYQGLYLPDSSANSGAIYGYYLLPEDGPAGPSRHRRSGPAIVLPESAATN